MSQLVLVFPRADVAYLPRLKSCVGTAAVSLYPDDNLLTWHQVIEFCRTKKATGIITTSEKLLKKLIPDDPKPSLSNYAGSYFKRDGVEIVVIPELPQLVSVPYGKFLTSRFVSKLAAPNTWNKYPEFSHEVLSAGTDLDYFSSCDFIAVDIETRREQLAITSVSYTGVKLNSEIQFKTVVIPCDSEYNLAVIKNLNYLPVRKAFQNGKYDISYLMRYGVTPKNYLFDSINMFHSWYSELPKDLGTLSAFFHREGRYWKDMRESTDQSIKLEYNGRDTYATAIVICEWLLSAPKWAKTNYLQEFPVVFPALLCEMTGIKRDLPALDSAFNSVQSKINSCSKTLDTMLGVTDFNVNSPKQMKQLLGVLGCKDIAAESTDEKHLAKASFRHPLINRILDEVLEIRGLRKLNSTYLVKGKELNGRILYSINPHGTDTGRLASKEHHFWCGLQIQNIPGGDEVKQTLVSDNGFRLTEADFEQAESRDTANISGDSSLIAAVSGERDFHSVNASAFFGVSYSSIYDDATHTKLNKALRDLAKKVNHGANYNMGPNVLVATMGLKHIYHAAVLLGLPKFWAPKQIAEYLLSCFHKTYPSLQKVYYAGVIQEVDTYKTLTSRAIHHSPYHVAGWTRYCFGDIKKDKHALNAYIAHVPQSLNAMTLNKSFLNVFYKIAINPEHSNNFRLLAQIHDSILFEFREGHEYLKDLVKECMEIPITIKSYDGITRDFTVPAALKDGKDHKGALRWSETE